MKLLKTNKIRGGGRTLAASLLSGAMVMANTAEGALVNESRVTLPFVPAASVTAGSGDLTVDPSRAVIVWNFSDANSPLSDAWGHGANMAVSGSGLAVVSDAVRGNVLSFDGASYLKGPGSNESFSYLPADGTSGREFTVAAWIKPDAACTDGTVFYWGAGATAQQSMFRLGNDDSTSPMCFSIWGPGNILLIKAATNVHDGAWHHVALTHNGNGVFTAYYDVTNSYSYTKTAYKAANKNFHVGRALSGNNYAGVMDDFTLLDVCLTASGVATLAAGGVSESGSPADVALDGSGSLFATNSAALPLATLSGRGILGGIESAGAAVSVGEGVTTVTDCVYSATIRSSGDAGVSFVKRGAGYGQVLAGMADGVANVTVEAGTLTLRTPLAREGLVCRYPFDADGGSAGFDAAPAGLALTEVDSGDDRLSFVSDGVWGEALHFPGSAYLSSKTAHLPSRFPKGASSFTVSAWIRPDSAACTGETPIFCWGSHATDCLAYLRFVSSTKLKFSSWYHDLEVSVPQMDDGEWHHVAAVYDSSTRIKTVYFDGVARGASNALTLKVTGGTEFQIGHGSVNDNVYAGDLDEFMVLVTAWTADDVKAEWARKGKLAAESVAAETLLPAPAAHYTFDDPDDFGADSSGNGLHLSTNGVPLAYATDPLACGGAISLTRSNAASTFPYLCLNGDTYDTSLLPWGSNPFTIVARYKPDTDQGNENNSVVTFGTKPTAESLEDGTFFRIGPSTGKTYAARVIASGAHLSPAGTDRDSNGTDRQRWTTIAVVYSPLAGGAEHVMRCYQDGVPFYEGTGDVMSQQTKRFEIGSDPNSGEFDSKRKSRFAGLIDDVQVYNCALSAGEVDLVTRRLAAGAGKSAQTTPRVLPETAAVAIAAGGVLNVRSTESVALVSGTGTIDVSPLASLHVKSMAGFSGTITGHGTVVVERGFDRRRISVADTVRLLAKTGMMIIVR